MKSSFALIFCISIILLVYLSGAINKTKNQLIALESISLYDSMTCMQECPEHKVLGTVEKGEALNVLNRIKGKSKIILRLESKDSAGWVVYDETRFQDVLSEDVSEGSQQ